MKSEFELGLKKKREKDENYRDDSDEDDPVPPVDPFGRPKITVPAQKKGTGEKPKIATLFNH